MATFQIYSKNHEIKNEFRYLSYADNHHVTLSERMNESFQNTEKIIINTCFQNFLIVLGT